MLIIFSINLLKLKEYQLQWSQGQHNHPNHHNNRIQILYNNMIHTNASNW